MTRQTRRWPSCVTISAPCPRRTATRCGAARCCLGCGSSGGLQQGARGFETVQRRPVKWHGAPCTHAHPQLRTILLSRELMQDDTTPLLSHPTSKTAPPRPPTHHHRHHGHAQMEKLNEKLVVLNKELADMEDELRQALKGKADKKGNPERWVGGACVLGVERWMEGKGCGEEVALRLAHAHLGAELRRGGVGFNHVALFRTLI